MFFTPLSVPSTYTAQTLSAERDPFIVPAVQDNSSLANYYDLAKPQPMTPYALSPFAMAQSRTFDPLLLSLQTALLAQLSYPNYSTALFYGRHSALRGKYRNEENDEFFAPLPVAVNSNTQVPSAYASYSNAAANAPFSEDDSAYLPIDILL